MKQISEEQIKQVMSSFYQANCSVQAYDQLQQSFDKLPPVEEVKEEEKEDKKK